MALDPEKWTNRTREAFQAGLTQATAAGHAEVVPAHMLAAILAQGDGIAPPLLRSLEVDPSAVARELGATLG